EGISKRRQEERIGTSHPRRGHVVISIGQLKAADKISKQFESQALVGRQVKILCVLDGWEEFVIMKKRHLFVQNRPIPCERGAKAAARLPRRYLEIFVKVRQTAFEVQRHIFQI